jgi:protein-L-isoaspartate(D-aspartate) O-methyltransferase
MTDTLTAQRRFFAEEIEAIANLRTPGLVDAFAQVAREAFLPPGPWALKSEAELGAPPRLSLDADPRRVYHNLAVGIDPARQLFNGTPSLIALCVDALALASGKRVLHLGCGSGYYTAVIAQVVGPTGSVVALEVDQTLAERARLNLAGTPWIDVRHGDGTEIVGEPFDAILVNAGVTHPQLAWLDALSGDGRLVLPLTASLPGMGPIGKGPMVVLTRTSDPQSFDARLLTFVAIFSAIGLRDAERESAIGQALARAPFGPIRRLRRGPHERSEACWLHGDTFCLTR